MVYIAATSSVYPENHVIDPLTSGNYEPLSNDKNGHYYANLRLDSAPNKYL